MVICYFLIEYSLLPVKLEKGNDFKVTIPLILFN